MIPPPIYSYRYECVCMCPIEGREKTSTKEPSPYNIPVLSSEELFRTQNVIQKVKMHELWAPITWVMAT